MTHSQLAAEDWYAQARRDLRAAEHLLAGGYHAHATVLAHLAVEKLLKGRLKENGQSAPPATHDLRLLSERLGVDRSTDGWTADLQSALDALADVSILSLYSPDRPFGHPVSDEEEPARERVASARMLYTWLKQTGSSGESPD